MQIFEQILKMFFYFRLKKYSKFVKFGIFENHNIDLYKIWKQKAFGVSYSLGEKGTKLGKNGGKIRVKRERTMRYYT